MLLILFDNVKAQLYPILNELDTVSVSMKTGFDAEDFIRMTKNDTSFLRAFKNLKYYAHSESSKVRVLEKDGGDKASMDRLSKLARWDNQAVTVITKETTEGKYYKRNGEHKYYTAQMLDKVFFSLDTFTVDNRVGEAYQQQKPSERSREAKHYEQLKSFMFSPGTGVDGVPFIGNKLDIFDGKMKDKYNFKIEKVDYKNSIPCYLFKVELKEETKENEVSIIYIHTYYDRRTMNIIARDYRLKDWTLLFNFDITINIELNYIKGEYLPSLIRYNGDWSVPLKSAERIFFEMKFKNYKI